MLVGHVVGTEAGTRLKVRLLDRRPRCKFLEPVQDNVDLVGWATTRAHPQRVCGRGGRLGGKAVRLTRRSCGVWRAGSWDSRYMLTPPRPRLTASAG